MSDYTPHEVKDALARGLLSFPVTHATEHHELDLAGYREHIAWLGGFPAAGLFAAGGTGEFFSLTPAEVAQVLRAAVDEAPEDLPILGAAGYGTRLAIEMAQDAERAGADALLLLPPYLVRADQAGLMAHVRAVCAATSLGVIVYHRDNGLFTAESVARLADSCANLIGFKDGVGDLELVTTLSATLGDRLRYICGLPTAEVFALPYAEAGVTTYSSAIFNFAPRFALQFFDAVRSRDRDAVNTALQEFVLPYVEIRNRRAGYAVSIVKAGMTAIGRSAGPVRPPLSDLTPAELDQLTVLVKQLDQ
jgi:5-dehydro-4-deoxyglucarate dehydratase